MTDRVDFSGNHHGLAEAQRILRQAEAAAEAAEMAKPRLQKAIENFDREVEGVHHTDAPWSSIWELREAAEEHLSLLESLMRK